MTTPRRGPPPPPPPPRAPKRSAEPDEERTRPNIQSPTHHHQQAGFDETQPPFEGPILEIAVHREHGPPATERWRGFEIWTRNRVYVLDSALRCFEVIDLESRQAGEAHPALGGRLVGGQRTEGAFTELAQPFPPRGFAAVFEQARADGGFRYVRTSKVKRVIVRERIQRVDSGFESSWEELSRTR